MVRSIRRVIRRSDRDRSVIRGEEKKERERSRVEKTRVSAARATRQCVSEYSSETGQ